MKEFVVTLAGSGKTFRVREGENVLAAALRQGVMLPYSCKNGTCGSCKGLLQEGLGLSEPEAFRWIQKTAMDLRKSMREVAEGVIDHAKAGGKPRPLK